MRITLINGAPDPASGFEIVIDSLTAELVHRGHAVNRLELRNLQLKGCSGCWGCWVKTPGLCVKKDDSAILNRTALNSDLLLLASPLTVGFTSALLKRATDQMIPLLHPYVLIEGGEMHHRARYARFPALGLLLGIADDSDAEDVEITTSIWRRTARNLKSQLVFTAVSNRTAGEMADAIALVA